MISFTLDEGSMVISKTEYLKQLHEAVGEKNREADTLEIVASAMAYFKLAFKRYADMVSMTIIHVFIDNFSNYIGERLIKACYPIDGEENFDINELIKEDDSTSRLREDLRGREKHLQNM